MPFPPPHPDGRRLTAAKNGITLRTATTATATVDYDHEGAEAYTVGLRYGLIRLFSQIQIGPKCQ